MTFGLFPFIPIQSLAILSSVAIATGSYLFVCGFRLLVRQRSLLTTPTSRIGSVARGSVEVSGVAAGPCTTLAPITEEPCFLYHTTAWRQRGGEKNEWERVADENLHLPFFIDDSTGRLLVEARGADLELDPWFRGEYSPTALDSADVPLSVIGFLSRHDIALDRNLRIEERLIKNNDTIFVAGTLMENPGVRARAFPQRRDLGNDRRNPVRDPARNMVRDTVRNAVPTQDRRTPARNRSSEPFPAPEVIRLASAAAASSTQEMTQQAKIAAALTRASGKAETRSFDGVPAAAVAVAENVSPVAISVRSELRPREMRHESCPNDVGPEDIRRNEPRPNHDQAESSDFDLTPQVVLMKGTDDPTFVISFRSQKEIVSATPWKAGVIVCVGTALTLLGLYMLCAQLALL